MKKHWRMRWDPNAEYVFCKRMRVGGEKKPYAMPGDKVTKALRERIGPHRLRRWFETGVIEIKGWKAPEPQREKALRMKQQREDELAQKLRCDTLKLREGLEAELKAGE